MSDSHPTSPLSGALSAEWRDITHHSARNAPLNGDPADGEVIAVRGNATDDELAAVLAALAGRPSTVDNPYERWRRARLAAIRRTDVGHGPIR